MRTLESFRRLDYSRFEVCLVAGPTQDGTRELVSGLAAQGEVKATVCDELNLSVSRNLGIALAAGELVAFIDDDAIPEPEWLSDLAPAFDDRSVGGAGGFTYDHTGAAFQSRFMLCDRLGGAELIDDGLDGDDHCYPFAPRFPGLLGTNSVFRREALLSVGGFDEEFEYYLDETDLCCRLIDHGWIVRELDRAFVHHKFLPSHLRNTRRVLSSHYAVLKNKIYFSLVNNHGMREINDIVRDGVAFVDKHRRDVAWAVENGRLPTSAPAVFEAAARDAWRDGLARGLAGRRRMRPASAFAAPPAFKPARRLVPPGVRRRLVFLSQSYFPSGSGGNARHTHDIARAIAALGHDVHVLTRGAEFDRVDLEEGVWVRRLVPRPAVAPPPIGLSVPAHIWDYASTMRDEVLRLHRVRPVDAVEAVSWDCEGAACVFDGSVPSAVNIVTSLPQFIESHPELAATAWMETFGAPMRELEREVLQRADGLVAASRAIARELESTYPGSVDPVRLAYCPHGLADMRDQPRAAPALFTGAPAGRALLFVGRLEPRKGVHTLLAALPAILEVEPNIQVWIAGDDTLTGEDGQTPRARFEASEAGARLAQRVRFLGQVSEAELRWLYAHATVFVVPSRFESFGLIYVEAMMFSLPIVACLVGGVPEVVQDGMTGRLVPPDDREAIVEAVLDLLRDPTEATRLGTAGRRAYEERFEAGRVATLRVEALAAISVHRSAEKTS